MKLVGCKLGAFIHHAVNGDRYRRLRCRAARGQCRSPDEVATRHQWKSSSPWAGRIAVTLEDMHYRGLGRTGWEVSEISFGAWAIGGSWGSVDDKESLAALHSA